MYVIQVVKRIYGKSGIVKNCVSYLHLKYGHDGTVGVLACLAQATLFATIEDAAEARTYLRDIYDDIVSSRIIEYVL